MHDGGQTDGGRGVIDGALAVMRCLRALEAARISEVARRTQLPRTTVDRLLRQLESAGMVRRAGRGWELLPALGGLAEAPRVQAQLRPGWAQRRVLFDLVTRTSETASLTIGDPADNLIFDMIPGVRPLPVDLLAVHAPDHGRESDEMIDHDAMAGARAYRLARRGAPATVIEAGETHPAMSCVAVPFRTRSGALGSVQTVVAGRRGVAPWLVEATAQAAAAIGARVG